MLESYKARHPQDDRSFKGMLSDLSLRLLEVNPRNVDSEMRQYVEEIGEFYSVDRVEIRRFNDDRSATTILHGWVRSNETGVTADVANYEIPWAAALMLKGQVVRMGQLSDMPPEAATGRAMMEREGLAAVLLVPLTVNEQIFGALVLASQEERAWSDEIVRESQLLGDAMASALTRVQLHNSLSMSEARLRAVIENQTVFVIRWLPDGTRTWVNDKYCEAFQQSRVSMLGTSFLPLVAPAHRQMVLNKVKAMTPDNPTHTDEQQVLLPFGKTGWQSWTDTGLFDDSGNLIEIQSEGRDITGRKRTEEALMLSEYRYRNLVENSTDWIWEKNLGGKYTYSNDQLEVILGYTAEEIQEISFEQLFHPDDLPAESERLSALIDNKLGWEKWVARIRHKDGSYRYIDSSAKPVFDDDGNLYAHRGVDRDITDATRAQQEIERRAQFQKRLADLSTNLLISPVEETVRRVEEALGQIGVEYELFSIGIWWFSEFDGEPAVRQAGWRGDQDAMQAEMFRTRGDDMSWYRQQLKVGNTVQVDDFADMPDEARGDAEWFQQWGIVSLLGIPAQVGDKIAGFCTYTSSVPRIWDAETLQDLRLMADVLTGAFARSWAAAETARRANFQRFLAKVSSSLLMSRVEETHQRVSVALKRIGSQYDLYSIGIWWVSEGSPGQLHRLDGWRSDDGSRPIPPDYFGTDPVPWITSQLIKGQTLRIDDVGDMPDEARADQVALQSWGTLSLLCLPAYADNRISGRCFYNSSRQRHWDEETVRELQLLANAVIGACARHRASDELSRREQELVRSQYVGRLGSFSLTVDDASVGFPPTGRLAVSPQFCELFDMDAEQASFELVASRIHPDDAQRVFDLIEKGINFGTDFRETYRVVRTDGTVIHIDDRTTYHGEETGRTKAIFGTVQDVTEQVEAKNKIKSALAEIKKLKDQLQEENVYLREEVRAAHGFKKIIGSSPKLNAALSSVTKVAPTDVTVLILGETGTGKELVAHAIHDLSARRDNALISVNCAALSADLIESELFGHEKGAFTGAHMRRKGRFELAHGGTLFLDEIGELRAELQAKLLRVLQTGSFERLGGSKTLQVDVRLIAATNTNLLRAVDNGEFRADLYYRIGSFPIELPPLRERAEDIPAITEFLVRKHAKRMGKDVKSISVRTIRYLVDQKWPGNVRELEGFIKRALISVVGSILDYSEDPQSGAENPVSTHASADLRDAERQHILKVLGQTGWVIDGRRGAASVLGVPPSTLRSMMKRLGIKRVK